MAAQNALWFLHLLYKHIDLLKVIQRCACSVQADVLIKRKDVLIL